ncbi:transcription antitermination factor NusB [Candidatus Babeliales bacterium]|nr:transcription antitermination factor NusB [Candidatus Babeliales bacterium]
MYYFSTDKKKSDSFLVAVEPNLQPINPELEVSEEDDDEIIEFGQPVSQRELRAVAFHLVYAVDRSDGQLQLSEAFELMNDYYDLGLTEYSFAYTFAHGTIEAQDAIDEQIKPFLKNWEFNRLGCCTKLILRMAFWEIQQPHISSKIVINEAIELAKGFAEQDAYKFINGLLDEFSKARASDVFVVRN